VRPLVSKNYDLRYARRESVVFGKALRGIDSGFLEKAQLLKLKLKAIRSGVWFRALPRIDRVLVDLTIKVAGNVRSCTLAESILTVVRKLECLLENKLHRAVREVGLPVARELSFFAQKWGNVEAKDWVSDGHFVMYWAAMSINEPLLFRG
jgi:hypothetical protein